MAFGKRQFCEEASDAEKRAFCGVLRLVKNQILQKIPIDLNTRFMPGDFPSHVPFVIPQRLLNNNWNYDLKASPFDYLPCMIYMMRFIEERGETIPYHVFPQRTSLIPGYITLDTKAILDLLGGLGTALGSTYQYQSRGKAGRRNLTQNAKTIWSKVFHTQLAVFKKYPLPTSNHPNQQNVWKFNNMIQTDGIGCSILLKKLVSVPDGQEEASDDVYIQDANVEELQGKRIVAIDPGKSDLLFCVSKVPPPVIQPQVHPPQVEM